MLYFETNTEIYRKMSKLLPDIMPNIKLKLIVADTNLQRLGFVDYTPCKVQIDITDDDYLALLDDLIQIEVDAFNTIDGKDPPKSDPYYQKYDKYGWMYDILFGAKDMP